jgi:alkanesulfonate monooxygenase SsuD/methylene tetrahydromethanopterin reductase-like flavin-dependent oxidoreductase (luciferase family)
VDIGIGLPNPVPGTPGDVMRNWASRAEERGFTGLATIDRVVFPSYDSLISLAAAAGATTRVRLLSNILLGPVYPAPLLAKAAASLDQISGGRFTLGLAPGGRPDDYAIVGRDFDTRGHDFDAQLDLMHRAWRGEPVAGGDTPITPTPTGGDRVPILIGGSSGAAIRRMVTWADGITIGGAPPEMAGQFAATVRTAWTEAGRAGEPRIAALTYYSLGEDAEEESFAYLRRYYGFLGEWGERIAGGALRSESAIRGALKAYADGGITELYFDPTAGRLDQVDRLADVVL